MLFSIPDILGKRKGSLKDDEHADVTTDDSYQSAITTKESTNKPNQLIGMKDDPSTIPTVPSMLNTSEARDSAIGRVVSNEEITGGPDEMKEAIRKFVVADDRREKQQVGEDYSLTSSKFTFDGDENQTVLCRSSTTTLPDDINDSGRFQDRLSSLSSSNARQCITLHMPTTQVLEQMQKLGLYCSLSHNVTSTEIECRKVS
ncbi:hypothetical protein V1511DRAFT_154155 [Dipodascopsis uninucleata]